MSVAVDKFNYTLPYKLIFGGVTAMAPGLFRWESFFLLLSALFYFHFQSVFYFFPFFSSSIFLYCLGS